VVDPDADIQLGEGDTVSTVINLVSSDPQLVQLVREAGVPCVVVSKDALTEMAGVGTKQPAVLIVDLRQDDEIPQPLAQLKRHHPTTGVLVVSSKLDPALMLEAMRAGVNEFVTSPVTVPDLQGAIKRLMGNLVSTTRGEIYAFIGAKGGVGATTVAVNTATSLAKHSPDSTLMIDLNAACGDAAVFLGAEPRFSVMDALENVGRLDAAFFSGLVVRTKGGLDLLGAAARPVSRNFEPGRIRTLLDFASQTYRYTVLDVPRSDAAALDSLELVTKIVLVVNQELATVRNASRTAATLKQRYGPARLSVVLARTDRRAEIGLDDVERTVGIEISHTIPSDYRLALQAMNKGRPIVLDGSNELASAFKLFARELVGAADTAKRKEEKTRATGLFGRLAPKKA
jgi:pilus assembly protein CpaE